MKNRVIAFFRRFKQFDTPQRALLFSAVLAVYVTVVIRTAWMSDDAFITFRTIDNFVHGLGLTWNVPIRLQVYTHPLWMFFLTPLYVVTREPYYTTIIASILLNVVSISILLLGGKGRERFVLVPLAILTFSRAFIDFSTSGLEQPMSFLLLSLFITQRYRREQTNRTFFFAVLIAAAATLNRTDLLLIFVPPLAEQALRRRSLKTAVLIVLGFTPVFLWEIFSIIYYGFFVPNTAFAKLGHGLPKLMVWEEGLRYMVNSLINDPLTLFSVTAGLLTVLSRRSRRFFPLAIGVGLYLAYTVYIGGDFMSGRFFAVPLFVAVFLIAQYLQGTALPHRTAALIVTALLGLSAPYPTVTSGADFGEHRKTCGDKIDAYGIADERAYWYHCAGMLSATRNIELPICFHPVHKANLLRRNEKFLESGGPGFLGYYLGPDFTIFDGLGMAEPLMARLHSIHAAGWRPGHYPKWIPEGYFDTLKTGVNTIKNKDIKKYYDVLYTIMAGDIFTLERFREIWKMNTGKYEPLIPKPKLKPPVQQILPIAAFSSPQYPDKSECKDGSLWYYQNPKIFSTGGISHKRAIEFSANDEASYLLELRLKDKVLEQLRIPDYSDTVGYIRKHCIPLAPETSTTGFDQVQFQPLKGYRACFSYIRLVDSCDKSQAAEGMPRRILK